MADLPARAPAGRLSPERMIAARGRIDPRFLDSPQARCDALSDWLGCALWLKDESANPLGSFKGRGAHAFVAQCGDADALVCASAGNFGMALAHAGRRHRVPVTVFVSRHANPVKVDGIRRFGAQVRVAGGDFDAAKAAARAFALERGLPFVEDGRDPAISEGAGTIGLELLALPPRPEVVILPLGNGALLAGVGTAIKVQAPQIEVIGVVAAGAPVMRTAWHALRGHSDAGDAPDAACDTIADGIAVRVPVPEAVQDLLPVVDDILAVDDAALRHAMRELHARTGRLAEPSAVAGLAALHEYRDRFAGRRVATVLTGRNLTAAQIAAWLAPET